MRLCILPQQRDLCPVVVRQVEETSEGRPARTSHSAPGQRFASLRRVDGQPGKGSMRLEGSSRLNPFVVAGCRAERELVVTASAVRAAERRARGSG